MGLFVVLAFVVLLGRVGFCLFCVVVALVDYYHYLLIALQELMLSDVAGLVRFLRLMLEWCSFFAG